MRKNVIDNVEVVEPPIEELSKRRSSFKRTCLTGCGCILIFFIGAVVALKIAVGPGPKTIKSVPENFPGDIPIYDKDNIEQITFISGKYKNRGMEIAAFFPKIILSPLLIALNKDETSLPPANTTSTMIARQAESLKKIWKLIATPVGDHRDTVQIEWRNMDAEPSFVVSYYRNELRKKNYKIDAQSEGADIRQFSFSGGDISGSLFVKSDEEDHPGTDYAALTVNLPDKSSQ